MPGHSKRDVSLVLQIPHVLRTTAACNFSFLIWADGSAPAASASLLFHAPEAQIIGKTQCVATFLPFYLFVHLTFFLLTISLL